MTQIRDSRAAILRGVMNRCPSCGEGQLMQGYLKVNPVCAHCQAPLSRYPAADGPAFFTMTVMLLVLIPLFGIIWNVWRPEPATLLAVTGLTHRESYKDIFAITLIATAAAFFVIGVYYATGIV